MITLEPPRTLSPGADPWIAVDLPRAGLLRFLRSARTAVGMSAEVDVLLAGDRTLRRLNRQFRGKDKATDVLSFPAPEPLASEHAGDLAVSLETAQRQAAEHGHTLQEEVKVLLLHGLLHLHGMDHETDSGEMANREAALRAKMRLPVGLIARAGGSVNAHSNVLNAKSKKAKNESRHTASTAPNGNSASSTPRRLAKGLAKTASRRTSKVHA